MGAPRPPHSSSQLTSLAHESLVTSTSERNNGSAGGGGGGGGSTGGDGGDDGGDRGNGGDVGEGGVCGLSAPRQQPAQSQPRPRLRMSQVNDLLKSAQVFSRPQARRHGSSPPWPAAAGRWQRSRLRRTAEEVRPFAIVATPNRAKILPDDIGVHAPSSWPWVWAVAHQRIPQSSNRTPPQPSWLVRTGGVGRCALVILSERASARGGLGCESAAQRRRGPKVARAEADRGHSPRARHHVLNVGLYGDRTYTRPGGLFITGETRPLPLQRGGGGGAGGMVHARVGQIVTLH